MKKIGFIWLQEKLNINGFQLTHESYIGSTDKTEVAANNSIIRTFKSKYDVNTDTPLTHLEFALKYDDLNLAFINEVFSLLGHQVVSDYVIQKPNRKYARIIGFLYEFTSKKVINGRLTITYWEQLNSAQ